MISVFVFGKLGKVIDNARELYVKRVPFDSDNSEPHVEFDTFHVKYWTRTTTSALFKMKDGKSVAIKGRLSVENDQVYIIAEHIDAC